MERVAIRQTELPGTSRLAADYLYHFSRVAAYYGGDPAVTESYRSVAGRLRFPASRRRALVEALRGANRNEALLERLARSETVVVATGQQVGLFSGPCYSLYKALTAVKLARHLESLGLAAVPVFWLATEDHDFAEVSRCWSFDGELRPVCLAIEAGSEPARPVGLIPLHKPPLNELRASLSPFPYGDEIATVVETCYAPGKSLGRAFQELMERLLPGELLYLDPLAPAIRPLGAPLLREALLRNGELNQRLRGRRQELEARGYHAQVRVEESTSLLFLLDRGRRLPLRRSGPDFEAGGARYPAAELAARAGELSPNALLRPVLQDYLLPTVASIAGPAEVAYLAQSAVLYQALLGRTPVTVPRRGFTLLDARAARIMKRHALSVPDLLAGLAPVKERIARALVPGEIEEALGEASRAVAVQLAALRRQFAGFDPTLAAALDESQSKILYQLEKIGRKTRREVLRRDERAAADASRLVHLVYPHRHLQERFYTILPFLARWGLDFVDQLYENVDLDSPDHVVLAV